MNSYEDILKRLTEYKKTHENHLLLLENVKILTKKDGTHFKNLNQNFENGKIVPKYFSRQYFEIYGRNKENDYISYEFDVTDLTVDEIIQKIENEKALNRKYIKQYEEEINASKQVFDIVDKKVQELKEIIVQETIMFREGKIFGKSPCSLQYAIEEYVRSQVRFLR